MKKFLLLCAAVISLHSAALAQVASPPTLALGVAGVVGEKGSIDIDLLAGIISGKQAELKKEFIKKSIFHDLDNRNYVIWEYMYSSMNVLLESESKEAIKKNLLENSTNLALVYGFSELYLQIVARMCNGKLDTLLTKYDPDYASEFKCPKNISSSVNLKLANLTKYSKNINNEEITFSAFFLDMVFDVLRNNKEVTETLGFFSKPFPLGRDFYESRSAYFKIKNDVSATSVSLQAEGLRARLEKEVNVLLKNYILLKKLKDTNKNLDELIADYKDAIKSFAPTFFAARAPNALAPADSAGYIFEQLARESKVTLFQDLRSVNSPDATRGTSSAASGNTAIAISEMNQSDNDKLSEVITENLAAFTRFLGKNGNDFDQNDLYYLESSIKPLLVKLVTERNFDPKYLSLADQFEKLITLRLLSNLNTALTSSGFNALKTQKISSFGDILELITRLDKLDKVETYQFVLKTIQDVGEIFGDKKLGMYVKVLVDNLQTYTVIKQEEKKVEVAVEDIIMRIYDKYATRQSGIFSLYFSVGINQSIGSNFTFKTLLPDSTGFKTDTLKSVAYVSEKIGVKVKLVDFKWRRSFGVGETYESRLFHKAHTVNKFRSNKPLVSDIYFIGYGSGLLYKVANLATRKEFKDPIMGVGIGVAFFNSLDLNIGYNWPLQSNHDFFDSIKDQRIWSISFDIKIADYLTALGKKKQTKKD